MTIQVLNLVPTDAVPESHVLKEIAIRPALALSPPDPKVVATLVVRLTVPPDLKEDETLVVHHLDLPGLKEVAMLVVRLSGPPDLKEVAIRVAHLSVPPDLKRVVIQAGLHFEEAGRMKVAVQKANDSEHVVPVTSVHHDRLFHAMENSAKEGLAFHVPQAGRDVRVARMEKAASAAGRRRKNHPTTVNLLVVRRPNANRVGKMMSRNHSYNHD